MQPSRPVRVRDEFWGASSVGSFIHDSGSMLDVKMATKARSNLEKKLHVAWKIHNGSIAGDSWLLISYSSGAHSILYT